MSPGVKITFARAVVLSPRQMQTYRRRALNDVKFEITFSMTYICVCANESCTPINHNKASYARIKTYDNIFVTSLIETKVEEELSHKDLINAYKRALYYNEPVCYRVLLFLTSHSARS